MVTSLENQKQQGGPAGEFESFVDDVGISIKYALIGRFLAKNQPFQNLGTQNEDYCQNHAPLNGLFRETEQLATHLLGAWFVLNWLI